MDEAAQDLREELQKSLQPFEERLKLFEEVKVEFDQTAGWRSGYEGYILNLCDFTTKARGWQLQSEDPIVHWF